MAQNTPHPEYKKILTDSGKWLHAPGGIVFVYLENDLDDKELLLLRNAFEHALNVIPMIKKAVKTATGQDLGDALVHLVPASMNKIMNSIEGIHETSLSRMEQKGSGTALSIQQRFLAAVLAGAIGDVAPLQEYLSEKMADEQGRIKESSVTEYFGLLIGLIYLEPESKFPVTKFKYGHLSEETSKSSVDSYGLIVFDYDYEKHN